MKIICARTNAIKRRTPRIATEPGVRKLFEELARTELVRLDLAGRMVFDLTFLALILRDIILTFTAKFSLFVTLNIFCKIKTNFNCI